MTQTYADARAVAAAAPVGEITLPPYTGSTTDLAYLKSYVVSQMAEHYGVSAATFDQATVFSTSLVRDFVHRAMFQSTTNESIDAIAARGDLIAHQNDDVATAFRYHATGACGLAGWQEYQVFRALGFETRDIAGADSLLANGASHTTTEVFVADLGKWIVQDATFNQLIRAEADGRPLSWHEARTELFSRGGDLIFDGFTCYTYYWAGLVTERLLTEVEDSLENSCFNQVYWVWDSDGQLRHLTLNIFPDPARAHDPSSDQGGMFADAGAAQGTIAQLAALGLDWLQAAKVLRDDGLYVSGFADEDSHWITVRLADGSYHSQDLDSGTVLAGSLDQLWDQRLAPSQVYVLDHRGAVMDGLVDDPQPMSLDRGEDLFLRNGATGEVLTWNLADGDTLDGAGLLSSASDVRYSIVDNGNYAGDGSSELLWHDARTRQVGLWDSGNAEWTYLGVMGRGWSLQSHDGGSDFRNDGYDDLLWRNDATGEVRVWNIVDGANAGTTRLGTMNTSWKIAGTGDFNGDGTDDILWRHARTGEVREWLIEDGRVQANQNVGRVPTNWTIAGTGDFNGDGSSDILWRGRDGALEVWSMNGGTKSGQSHVGNLSSAWSVVACVDVTGEGVDDIVVRNGATGEVRYWDMDGDAPVLRSLGTLDADWLLS